jgi:hypothetical protein
MSMNVFISATRKVTFKKKNGKRGGGIQTEVFKALQTPTKVTYEIVNSSNPQQAYIDWVKTMSQPERMPVYADDDIFGEGTPIGFEEYDFAQEHIDSFLSWTASVEEDGYTVKFEVI